MVPEKFLISQCFLEQNIYKAVLDVLIRKKGDSMAAKARDIERSEPEEQYELVPYKEIQDLKHELSKLKEIPIPTTKKLQVSIDELAMKLDRLTAIFEEAGHEIKTEEGGLTFQEKMKPLFEKMNKLPVY